MKAIHLYAQSGAAQIVYENAPQPQPGPGEVLVRVYAAGVTPAEPAWPGIWKTSAGGTRSQVIPGHELAGIVEEVGPDIMGVSIGEEVYGLTDFARDGAQAEFTIALPGELAPRPRSLDLIQAAAVPLAALTVWQAFFDHANLSAGQTILIHGAAGGVGLFAVQIAHWAGARVIGVASARQHHLLHSLGADELIDYTTTRFEDVARQVDVVLDTIGGETLERSWGVLKPGGALVSLVEPPSRQRAAAQGVRAAFFVVRPNRAQLERLSALIDAGRVRPVIQAVLPLAQARRAYEGRHHSGKTVLQVIDEDKLERDVAEHEHESLEDYSELGMTGDMTEQQAYQEEFASGEVSRELREMRHGEFGPKAYEWLEKEHEHPPPNEP